MIFNEREVLYMNLQAIMNIASSLGASKYVAIGVSALTMLGDNWTRNKQLEKMVAKEVAKQLSQMK